MAQGADQGVGARIKRLREEREWSMAKLAVEADMSVSGVSMIETGKRNLTTTTLAKLARAFGVEVADLFPKAQNPLPLETETANPRVREWLRDQGASFALMTREEFSELVLDADTLEDVEELVGRLNAEEVAVQGTLMREFGDGGELFPKVSPGPGEARQALSRTGAVSRLQRAFADDYHRRRLALVSYSRKLYLSKQADDFLAHPREEAEAMRQQMLEEAFAEELVSA